MPTPSAFHRRLIAAVPSLGAAAFVVVPVIAIVALATGDDEGVWGHLVDTRLAAEMRATLLLCLGTAIVAGVSGTATAWLVSTCRFPGRAILAWGLVLPIAVPAYLSAYAYTDLLQPGGPIDRTLRAWFGEEAGRAMRIDIRSLGGAIFVLGFALAPYVFLIARDAFRRQSGAMLEAARTLGRGPWSTCLTVAIPLARPAIAGGVALVVMETIADFGAVDHFAVDTLATSVYRTWAGLDAPAAAARMSLVLLSIVSLLIVLELFVRRRRRHHGGTERCVPLRRAKLRRWSAAGAAIACAIPGLFGFVVPVAIFVTMTVRLGIDTEGGVLHRTLIEPAVNSITIGSTVALIAVTLATAAVFARRIRQRPLGAVSLRIAAGGYAIPGPVVAVGILMPLAWLDHRLAGPIAEWTGGRPGLLLTGSIAAVVIGCQTRFLAVAIAQVEAGYARVRGRVDDAARTLGAGPVRLFFGVHLPLLRGGLATALLLVFVDAIKELPITLMLQPAGYETLAVRTWKLASDERIEEAALGALAIVLLGLVAAAVLGIDRTERDASAPAPAEGEDEERMP